MVLLRLLYIDDIEYNLKIAITTTRYTHIQSEQYSISFSLNHYISLNKVLIVKILDVRLIELKK